MTNNKLKVAFCYSGFIRNFKKNLEKNKKIIDNLNPDIFIYTYDSFGYKNNSSIPEPKNNIILDQNYFSNISNIKDIFIEKFKRESIEDLEDKNIIYYMHDNHAYPKNILSQLYCINKCNSLKKEYEKKYNFEYDFVFRIRPDSYLENLDLELLTNIINKKNTIFVSNENGKYWGSYCSLCAIGEEHLFHVNDISDIFAFGDSKSMNYYSSLFLIANKLHDDMSGYNKSFFEKNKKNMKILDNKKIVNFKILDTSKNKNKDFMNNECYLFYPESLLRFYLSRIKVLGENIKVFINREEIY